MELKSNVMDTTLTIVFPPRIDTNNAAEFEAATTALRKANPHTTLVLDAEELDYISSVGLRAILRMRKEEKNMEVINTQPGTYDIFDMTGFTDLLTVRRAYRRFTVEGYPIIGQGAKGIVYRCSDDTILKAYRRPDCLPDIMRERELARNAFLAGIPTAISFDVVRVGESYGAVFELLDAASCSQCIVDNPDKLEHYAAQCAELLRTVHSTSASSFGKLPDEKNVIHKWLTITIQHLSSEDTAKLSALIKDVPDTDNLLHCDFHTNNILMQNGEALLIDMDTLSSGHPVFELANTYIAYVGFGTHDPAMVSNFLGMPYEMACDFWKAFLPQYLQSDDAAYIELVEKKVRLVATLRLIYHFARRPLTDASRVTIDRAYAELRQLMAEVDTLVF